MTVHHAEDSQFLEDTITASETELICENSASDTDHVTPGQVTPFVESGAQASLHQEEIAVGDELLMETGSSDQLQIPEGSQGIGSQPVRRGLVKRDLPSTSTDEENENTIGLRVGSFVRLCWGRSGRLTDQQTE